MFKKVLHTLEFDKITLQLADYASSELAAKMCRELLPITDLVAANFAQQETDEAVTVYRLAGDVPLIGIYSICPHLKRAEIGGMLNPIELKEIGSVLAAAKRLKRFFTTFAENKTTVPILESYAAALLEPPELLKQIQNAIDDNGEVLDSASDTLRQLRQKLRNNEARVREKLEQMIRSANVQKKLSDSLITIRNDRLVIPVKQEHRGYFGGTIHDQSASGQTLFIEPQGIVELNNGLQNAKVQIQLEIEKILYQLSAAVAEHQDTLLVNMEFLTKIDFSCAKAKLAKAIKGSKPALNDQGIIKLKGARHPSIPLEEVVANDIAIGEDYRVVVITGPNTGGKTVALKTLGLCTLMAMAGLQISALDGSEVAVFQKVFADIGDEQSIEQSLSTFSSHMVNIVDILRELDHESLVLYDELGAGTDPGEGAALAVAILDESKSRGAIVAATTHYPELKAYGYNREQVMNASVEFDVESLSPTFKLLIGVPGKSNAFDISRKLGLDEQLIASARGMIGTDTNHVENMIVALEKARNLAEKDRDEAGEYLTSAEELQQTLRLELEQMQAEKYQYLQEARAEAEKIVNRAKRETDDIIRELRSNIVKSKSKQQTDEQIFTEAKSKLGQALPKGTVKKPITQKKRVQFAVGDDVKVLSFNQKGSILAAAGSNEWLVQLGIVKMKVQADDMVKLNEKKKPEMHRAVATVQGADNRSSFELDLRGERYEDALYRVEKFVDDAILNSYPMISIIHGHGTGALRQGVRQYLQKHRAVKSIRFGGQGEGGMGVTIAELK